MTKITIKTVFCVKVSLMLCLGAYLAQGTILKAQLPPPPPAPTGSIYDAPIYNQPQPTIPTFESPSGSPNIQPPPVLREYNFQAPATVPDPSAVVSPGQNNVLAPPQATDKQIPFYRVEVTADDISVLSDVKKVEPLAFFQQQQGVIYAGLFTEQSRAQQRLQQLVAQGLSAQIVPVNYSVSQSYNLPVQR